MQITLNADEIAMACIDYIERVSGTTVDAMGSGFNDSQNLKFIAEIEEKDE